MTANTSFFQRLTGGDNDDLNEINGSADIPVSVFLGSAVPAAMPETSC